MADGDRTVHDRRIPVVLVVDLVPFRHQAILFFGRNARRNAVARLPERLGLVPGSDVRKRLGDVADQMAALPRLKTVTIVLLSKRKQPVIGPGSAVADLGKDRKST